MVTNPSETVSYTTAENYLITSVSDFSKYVSRNKSVSAVSTGGGYQEAAYKVDGTINTGYIPNWRSLSNADNKKVISEKKKKKVKVGDRKVSNTGNELDKIKELKKQNLNFKRNPKFTMKKVTQEKDFDEIYDND